MEFMYKYLAKCEKDYIRSTEKFRNEAKNLQISEVPKYDYESENIGNTDAALPTFTELTRLSPTTRSSSRSSELYSG